MSAAADGFTGLDQENIYRLFGQNGTPGKYILTADLKYDGTITLGQGETVIDLNGKKLSHSGVDGGSSNLPMFNVPTGATLTILDYGQAEDNSWPQDVDEQGNLASVSHNADDGESPKLTYYVTKSSVDTKDSTRTIETTYRHEVAINGAIVGTTARSTMKLINVYGGTFNLQSGVLTTTQEANVGNLIYAENGSTVNMKGGYVCGGYCPDHGAGAGISVKNSTLSISNGVIAGNRAPSGGGVYADGSIVKVAGGVISGNSTLNNIDGFGGGIMAENDGSVTVSGGYITNNRYARFCGNDGNGCHGGAGLAARNGADVTIYGGQITGNYSEEAGGGVYVTNFGQQGMAWLDITGGNIASNVSYRSEGAGIRVGQRVNAMISGASKVSPVYITNNHCMSRFDWGGGGVFVQGDSNTASNAGRLFVYNSYISANIAGGYGGGVAVCPTGKTLVTNTEGTAIFGNSSADAEHDYKDDYDSQKNTGNEGNPHLSKGGHEKNQDFTAYDNQIFRENGHADFFLASTDHRDPIAAVIGKMLGGGDAQYSGSIELEKRISIPANGGVQVKKSIGLTSSVNTGDPAAGAAQNAAKTFITGNRSWNHGGGIMSNGDLYLGQPADTYVYPSLKLKASKALSGRNLNDGEFSFTVYRKDSDNPFANGTFNREACTEVGTANNNASGNITFNLEEQFATSGTDDAITYYLVENAGSVSGITYDPAVYEIKVTVEDQTTVLISVPTRDDPNKTIELKIHNYKIKNVSAVEHPKGETDFQNVAVQADATEGYYSIVGSDGGKTFTNKYTPYTSSGSWTPKATKVVKGGEMKEFTLEFTDNENFTGDSVKTVSTTAGGDNPKTLGFPTITYTLDSLKQSDTDVPGRGASKTFTYYVREKDDSSIFSHYKFDNSVYKFTVVATDNTNGNINCEVTYMRGTVGSGGEWVSAETEGHKFPDTTPTFTNTYSTSLPLSGMSGVTLTYLAGAAVLCAAAAWMHIRRKANAKGGERRE